MIGLIGAGGTMPTGALVAVVILGVVELGLAVYCIVDIIRRPAVAGGRKWLWILLVVFFNLVGSIIYLAVGREHLPVTETHAEPEVVTRNRAQAAADMLYGPAADADGRPGGGSEAGAIASSPGAASSPGVAPSRGADAAPGTPER